MHEACTDMPLTSGMYMVAPPYGANLGYKGTAAMYCKGHLHMTKELKHSARGWLMFMAQEKKI